jgi:lipopolysaccharide export system ATP-binding protein
MQERVLAARGLEKAYKGRRVVSGVDLEVRSGQVVGLLGPPFTWWSA